MQLFVKLHFGVLGHRGDPVKNSPPKEGSEKVDLQQVEILLPSPALLALWWSALSPSRGTGKSLRLWHCQPRLLRQTEN